MDITMIKISRRLRTVASLISKDYTLADVGTDHAYVPIYLIGQKMIPHAIAMDIGKGPLLRAKEHISLYGMSEYIETRLSDGVAALSPGEAGAILVAGMGGGLILHILEAGEEVCRNACELVLQPQSEIERVRAWLDGQGYVTDAEDFVQEDGKYYPMMRVHYEPGNKAHSGRKIEQERLHHIYGKHLLEKCHPVLLEYLEKERSIYQGIEQNLRNQIPSQAITKRRQEVDEILAWNGKALSYFK